jgi:integrase
MSKNWDGVRLCALICINSTANPKEAFTLRLRDIDMKERKIAIHSGGAKNVHRIRPIPMNDELEAACKEALARAQSMGSFLPDHYVFPFRIHSALHDPTRHQTTFKTGWNKIKTESRKYGLDIAGLRLEDMRHHAITALLEDPNVSEETAESLAGHIGKKTKKFYSHVRIEAQRKAVEGALSYPPKKPAISEVSTGDDDVAGLLKQLLAKLLKAG